MATPNLSQKQKIKCYQRLQQIWHEVCSLCGKTLDELNLNPFNPETGRGGFEIHHISYSHEMDDIKYQRFMCHGCNHKKEVSKQTILDFEKEISASHKANIQKHPIFIEWFSNKIVECNYHMTLSEAIAGGAYVSGANVKTVAGWLKPLYDHPEAPFDIIPHQGIATIYLKGKESRLESPQTRNDEFDFNTQKDNK